MQNNQFYNFTNKCDKCLTCLYYQYDCQGTDSIKKVNKCGAYENDPKAYVRQDRDDTYKEPEQLKTNQTYDLDDVKNQLQYLVNLTNRTDGKFVNLESPHQEADHILCELVKRFVPDGEKIVTLYESIDKWYS